MTGIVSIFSWIRILLFVSTLLTLHVTGFAQNSWDTINPLPKAREGRPAVAAVNNKIFVIGGSNGDNICVSNFVYDLTTQDWTYGKPLPTARRNAAVAVLHGSIHIIGGAAPSGTPHRDHFVYNPITDTWTTRAPLPFATTQASAVSFGDSIYFMGGGGGGGQAGDGSRVTAYCYRYDDTNNAWTRIASMPTPRSLFCAAIIGQSIFVIGGHGDGKAEYTANEMYDIPTNTWHTRASMPTARDAMIAEAVNGEIFVIGGSTLSNPGDHAPMLSLNEVYNPVLDRWHIGISMPTARYESGSTVVNNSIYVFGGHFGANPLEVVEVLKCK